MISKKIILSIVLNILLFNSVLFADDKQTPTGEDLLKSCQSLLSSETTQMQQMLCTWYILPCDCEQKDKTIPKVCLPDKVDEEELARIIVKELEHKQQLQRSSALFAANSILQKYYPCKPE